MSVRPRDLTCVPKCSSLRRQLAACVIVRGDAGHVVAEVPVDGDDGDALVHLQIRSVGQGDDAVGLVLLHQIEAFLLRLGVEVRDHQQTAVAPAHETAGDFVREDRIKWVTQGGHEQGDAVGFAGLETAGVGVHLVAQLLDSLLHPQAIDVAHGFAVDDLGHGAERDACFPCHVLDGGRSGSAHDDSHPLHDPDRLPKRIRFPEIVS